MGYLTIKGRLMTYLEYKDFVEQYKHHGLIQFVKIYEAHKDRRISQENLHWGEEIEYSLFQFDPESQRVFLTNQALKLIEEFNSLPDQGVHLHPEFGNWMVEAVPTEPYGAMEDIKELLSCYPKIVKR